MDANFKDDWLNRAFRLAFYLHGDRETAKRIATVAMSKLEVASNAQFKRNYYIPTGRAENARATRSRMSVSDLQLLQRLVYAESEPAEREKERNGAADQKTLLLYFVKHLVRITLKRNSFYVTLAVSRILHNYGTNDAMGLYNIVIQDPERVHDDYYYRSRKGVLMKELKTRFDGLLETVKVNRGEERFESRATDEHTSEMVRECLNIFTPWNSACRLPEKFDPFTDVLESFHFDKKDPDAEHRTELNRVHAVLHHDCLGRLTKALRLPHPQEKLEIPKFMTVNESTNYGDHNRPDPPDLSEDEIGAIKSVLAAQAENRKAMAASVMRVVADGAEAARFDIETTDSVGFVIDESAELIEVSFVEDGRETLLATHLLSFSELAKGETTQHVLLEGGQRVTFQLRPDFDEYGEVANINGTVKYAETAWKRRFALALRRWRSAALVPGTFLKPAMSLGLLLLAVTLGWLIFRNPGVDPDQIVSRPEIEKTPNVSIAQFTPTPDNPVNGNVPDKPVKETPNANSTEMPKKPSKNRDVPVTPTPSQRRFNEPPRSLVANNDQPKRRETTDANGVLRVPIRENREDDYDYKNYRQTNPTRNFSNSGKSLAEIETVYIDVTGDAFLAKQIREQLATEIAAKTRFKVVSDKESADAALKVHVRHESDGDTPEDRSLTLISRLVNAEGFVVYPNVRRISGWKYVGVISKLAPRLAADLGGASKVRK